MDAELSMLLKSLQRTPHDDLLWLAVADRLEEIGEPLRAELLRTNRRLGAMKKGRAAAERRIRRLLLEGVRPCMPEAVNSLGMRFVLVPAGTFLMGTAGNRGDRDERPRHEVEIERPFWLGVFPVTQDEYRRQTGRDPSYFSSEGSGRADVRGVDTSAFPVESVSWEECVAFCEELSALPAENAAGRVYGLPTEAEWEYACRAGLRSGQYAYGDELPPELANTSESGLNRPCPVGQYPPNAWGLHDIHGNIWEWCHDWYGERWYPESPRASPTGPVEGTYRVLRGGSWGYEPRLCRTAYRVRSAPTGSGSQCGFRLLFRK
ncbi:MAG: SUMF1/EgtB/PvdO family nonheme iron enzyme [Gemmataceae bacterium]|nr:SUMF1/EgtB/PvdO family nonheme iron enzyme [Gemmataceae bacterium]